MFGRRSETISTSCFWFKTSLFFRKRFELKCGFLLFQELIEGEISAWLCYYLYTIMFLSPVIFVWHIQVCRSCSWYLASISHAHRSAGSAQQRETLQNILKCFVELPLCMLMIYGSVVCLVFEKHSTKPVRRERQKNGKRLTVTRITDSGGQQAAQPQQKSAFHLAIK